MNPGQFTDRVGLEVKTTTPGPTGSGGSWASLGTKWARVIPLSAEARVLYGSLQGVVTHKLVFPGSVVIALGQHRINWHGRTLYPAAPAQQFGASTVVVLKEAP